MSTIYIYSVIAFADVRLLLYGISCIQSAAHHGSLTVQLAFAAYIE